MRLVSCEFGVCFGKHTNTHFSPTWDQHRLCVLPGIQPLTKVALARGTNKVPTKGNGVGFGLPLWGARYQQTNHQPPAIGPSKANPPGNPDKGCGAPQKCSVSAEFSSLVGGCRAAVAAACSGKYAAAAGPGIAPLLAVHCEWHSMACRRDVSKHCNCDASMHSYPLTLKGRFFRRIDRRGPKTASFQAYFPSINDPKEVSKP